MRLFGFAALVFFFFPCSDGVGRVSGQRLFGCNCAFQQAVAAQLVGRRTWTGKDQDSRSCASNLVKCATVISQSRIIAEILDGQVNLDMC
eukprot:s1160_g11.t1